MVVYRNLSPRGSGKDLEAVDSSRILGAEVLDELDELVAGLLSELVLIGENLIKDGEELRSVLEDSLVVGLV